MKFRNIAALLALSATLSACVSGDDSTPANGNPNAGFQVRYAPLGAQMPFPNDLYSGKNGQLAIPGDATVAQNGPLLEMNHLDGFGTQSDISIYFTQPVDKTTLTNSILVFKVSSDPATKAVTGFIKQLLPGTDYSIQLSPGIDSNGQIVTIKPLHPLAPSTADPVTHVPTFSTYLVIVTRGVKDTTGANVTASADYSAILAADTPALTATGADVSKINMAATDPLLPVAQFDLGQIAVAFGVIHASSSSFAVTDIANTFSFSTGFLKIALAEVAATATATDQTGTAIVDTTETVCDVLVASKQLPNAAACAAVPGSTVTEVYAGDVALPYYLTVPATGSKDALTDSWHNAAGGDIAASTTDPTSFVPVPTVKLNVIPILVAIPLACGAAPAGGWPVTIFQHGITRSREDMLPIASSLSVGGAGVGLCTAVLAIDLPLHGVTNAADPFYKNQLFTGTPAAALFTKPVSERTFDMDANGVAGAAAADIGGSGAQFINLSSTITSRDNLREGAADLINLVASLSNIKPGGVTLDHTKVFFVGHSLGAIIGTTFLGADSDAAALTASAPKVTAGVVAMPGGHIAELLRNSPTFGPVIDAGLAQQGIVKGTQSYYDFYSEAQTVVEDGDPANYAADAAAGHLMHMIEVVGGHDASSPPDQVVPNSATDVLIAQMGITTPITATTGLAAAHPTLAQFTTGDHGSILSPAAPSGADATVQAEYGAVTAEMQAEAASVVFDTLGGAPSVAVTSNTFLSPTLKK
jgi:hypothetical protein